MQLDRRHYNLLDLIRLPLQAAPTPALLWLLDNLALGFTPSLQVLATAGFINQALSILAGQATIRDAIPWIAAVAGLEACIWIGAQLGGLAKTRLTLRLYTKIRGALIDKRARLEYRHIEDHETWDLIRRVSDKPEEILTGGLEQLQGLARLVMQVAGLLLILLTQVWWAALVIVALAVPLIVLANKAGKANYDARKETAKIKRLAEYLSVVLKDRENIEERSMFGYSPELNERWTREFEKARKIEYRTTAKWFVRMKGSSMITAVLNTMIIGVLIVPAGTGHLSLGLFISLVTAVFGLVQLMSWSLTNYMETLARSREYMKDLTNFCNTSETPGDTDLPSEVPPLFDSLVFRNVSFTYPGTDRRILDHLNITMEAGHHYALVGVNGAGKTTITKLITGLYDDYDGQILFNGRDIREMGQSRRKALCSIVFQDFARYSVSLKDNIVLGSDHHMDDEKLKALLAMTELDGLLESLPSGWDTPLGKIDENGQDLSGGQWQRVALARALAGPAPLRILDEPTAALDPMSESRVYEMYGHLSHDRTTIFISHRLASTKMADVIFVIKDGQVAEQGSHERLMALGGLYADMFDTQRSWYT